MVKTLTPDDIRDLLTGFAAAIELDQIRVDALPSERFHPLYDDELWRDWRRDHISYIHQLLRTVNEIPVPILEKLTQLALTCEPAVVGQTAINRFGEAQLLEYEELETAAQFLEWWIQGVESRPEGRAIGNDPRALMMQWLPVTDPLQIAEDPECGYGPLAGFVS